MIDRVIMNAVSMPPEVIDIANAMLRQIGPAGIRVSSCVTAKPPLTVQAFEIQ